MRLLDTERAGQASVEAGLAVTDEILDPASDLEIEQNRRLAEISVSDARRSLDLLLEEHSVAFRWLMASFLAINSGGLFILKDLSTTLTWHKIGAGVAFYVGIITALAIAWLGQKACRAAVRPLSQLSGFWASTFAYGAYDIECHQRILDELVSATKKNKLAPLAGWLSLLSFTVGIALIGIMEIKKSQSVENETKDAVNHVQNEQARKVAK